MFKKLKKNILQMMKVFKSILCMNDHGMVFFYRSDPRWPPQQSKFSIRPYTCT